MVEARSEARSEVTSERLLVIVLCSSPSLLAPPHLARNSSASCCAYPPLWDCSPNCGNAPLMAITKPLGCTGLMELSRELKVEDRVELKGATCVNPGFFRPSLKSEA